MSGWTLVVLVAGSVIFSGVVITATLLSQRASARRLAPPLDGQTREDLRRVIQRAGSVDALVRDTLREASAAIERAQRAGPTFGMTDNALPVLLRAKREYARTGDDELDAFRALTLAREADALASQRAATNAPFDEWLRKNGHRFMT